jgi:fucose permease
MRLSRYCTLIFRIGFGLLVAAALSYLAAIWTSEMTSERFGLSGVLFMCAGLVAFLFGYLMSPTPSSTK